MAHERNVLIVERSTYARSGLRNAFINANTHVVSSFASAASLLADKRIDAVLLEFSTDPETVSFCKTLSALSVPRIFTSEWAAAIHIARKDNREVVAPIHNLVADQIRQAARQSAKLNRIPFPSEVDHVEDTEQTEADACRGSRAAKGNVGEISDWSNANR